MTHALRGGGEGGDVHKSDKCELPPAYALLILEDIFMTFGGKLFVDL